MDKELYKTSNSGKGSKLRTFYSKTWADNYDNIEFREKGTYCMECGQNLAFPFNKEKHLSMSYNSYEYWICNPANGCNFN